MSVIEIIGLALGSVLLLLSLRRSEPEIAMGLRIAAGILLAAAALSQLRSVLAVVETFWGQTGQSYETLAILLKALGICVLVQFAADACRDAGETALAGRVEFAGRTLLAVMAIPLFTQLLKIAMELIGG